MAHPKDSGEKVASGGSNPACLGELGGKHLSFSPINRGKGLSLRGPTIFALSFHLKLVRRRERRKKIQAKVLP